MLIIECKRDIENVVQRVETDTKDIYIKNLVLKDNMEAIMSKVVTVEAHIMIKFIPGITSISC